MMIILFTILTIVGIVLLLIDMILEIITIEIDRFNERTRKDG